MIASVFLAPSAAAAADNGGVAGWVESTRGVPLAGAVVSLFGGGARGNRVTLSDSRGRFMLPALPPGSYTLRAASLGHEPSAARRITVRPNAEAHFTVALAPAPDKGHDARPTARDGETDPQGVREWLWLLRHKRRSVLESTRLGPPPAVADLAVASRLGPAPARSLADLGPLAGTLEVATEAQPTTNAETDVGAVRLAGRLADGMRWDLRGLVSENDERAWRMAARFVIDPSDGHEIETGAGYGVADGRMELGGQRTQTNRTTGVVFAKDRWRLDDRVTATVGGRYTHLGFLANAHHADAVVAVEVQGRSQTMVHGSVATRSLAPGGDLLALSTGVRAPPIAGARLQDGLRPARISRCETGVERAVGAGRLGAALFVERASDALLTTFDQGAPLVRNGGHSDAAGLALSAAHRIGAWNGSITYTLGRGRLGGPLSGEMAPNGIETALFHDLVAHVETAIDWTDTRVTAVYRLNRMVDGEWAGKTRPPLTRFDIQVTQRLPFLQPLTRADWELLVAVRNMFYEASRSDFLDELSVERPPTRVAGGVSVRF